MFRELLAFIVGSMTGLGILLLSLIFAVLIQLDHKNAWKYIDQEM